MLESLPDLHADQIDGSPGCAMAIIGIRTGAMMRSGAFRRSGARGGISPVGKDITAFVCDRKQASDMGFSTESLVSATAPLAANIAGTSMRKSNRLDA